jgi:glycine/betaine/sarcosine/D-proline reductase family selenoprotein B
MSDPINYIDRTRDYYLRLGYDNPYEWANFDDVPFTKLVKPLAECRVALVTTAAPYHPDQGEQGPNAPYNSNAKFYDVYALSAEGDPDVRISHVAIDRDHTTGEDKNTWFPLEQLKQAAAAGRIGEISPNFYGLPTNRSQKTTLEVYCPDLLARLQEDQADVALLVPNCPVCHQSISLAARHLEENGIPTVIMGAAKDIVEQVGAPRFLFSDFPLGNAAGRPKDAESQKFTLDLALDVLEQADGPRTTAASPLQWSDTSNWKFDYSNADKLTPEEITQARAEFDDAKAIAKELRE